MRKIRIISGKWKGRKIPITCEISLRPTLNRVRETLFNWLEPIILNSICLDCFAGSGALGLESLSRGAQKVTFIDKNTVCINMLKKIVCSFQECKCEIIQADCRFWFKQFHSIFYDIIFIDPPFQRCFMIYEVIFLLEKYNYFKKQSWIYIEIPKDKNIFDSQKLPLNWFLYREMRTRNVLCYLYSRVK